MLSRLVDLGIEPFLIASAVIGVVAQRMVRRVCPDCSHPIEAPLVEQMAYEKEIGEKRTEFLYGTGCKTCAYTGYLGRIGIFEILDYERYHKEDDRQPELAAARFVPRHLRRA